MVITFDGNKKLEKKAMFKRVKEHLEEKYQRSISYGTVVQLCIARNK
jgi:ABC-type phosphate transport system ATPase subunit